jgi:hypothetical protein
MEHYVTLFDSFYLPQGLALHASMERQFSNYQLWILCVDDATHAVLQRLGLPNVRLLRLSQLETQELLRVKASRTKGEYCWTLTPFAPRFVFEAAPEVGRVTYVDADLWFRRNSAAIFRELEVAGKQVLITDHAYAADYDNSALVGQFCVQFMIFTHGGEPVRKWWEDRCIEWCHGWYEDGKMGDQKYLDDWPERFPEHVHVLQDEGLALGPWNATRFPYGRSVFYHFHSLRIASETMVEVGTFHLPAFVLEHVYAPYLRDLRAAVSLLRSHGIVPAPQVATPDVLKSAGLKLRRVVGSAARRLVNLGRAGATLPY